MQDHMVQFQLITVRLSFFIALRAAILSMPVSCLVMPGLSKKGLRIKRQAAKQFDALCVGRQASIASSIF
mgnify:CR=1 FL=1